MLREVSALLKPAAGRMRGWCHLLGSFSLSHVFRVGVSRLTGRAPGRRILISSTRKPVSYLNLAKRILQEHGEVQLSALGIAVRSTAGLWVSFRVCCTVVPACGGPPSVGS